MTDITADGALPEKPRERRVRNPEQWVHRSIEKYRGRRHQMAYRPDDAFFEFADAVVEAKLTRLGYDRLYVFWQAVRNLAGVPGVVAEIGAFRGGSAFFIASAFSTLTDEAVPMHVFDTFDGHPEGAISEHDPMQPAGRFESTSYDRVRQRLSPFPNVHVHQGEISATLPHVPESAYRLVHIDVDLYQPTLVCLDYFGARLSSGGIIVVDDYSSPKCEGVAKAVNEHLARGGGGYQIWDVRTEQLLLVKR